MWQLVLDLDNCLNYFCRPLKAAKKRCFSAIFALFFVSFLRFVDHMYKCVLEQRTTLRLWLLIRYVVELFGPTLLEVVCSWDAFEVETETLGAHHVVNDFGEIMPNSKAMSFQSHRHSFPFFRNSHCLVSSQADHSMCSCLLRESTRVMNKALKIAHLNHVLVSISQ